MRTNVGFFFIIVSFGISSTKAENDGGFCHTAFGEGMYKCLLEGKYRAKSYEECCSPGNATGYSVASSGFKALKDLFLRKKQTNCQPCSDSFNKKKKWCFVYRNPSDFYCIHIPKISTIEASNETDCCLWWNASGYTEAPRWKWSSGYNRWITQCSSCIRDKFVACFKEYTDDKFRGIQCSNALPRLAESPHECCKRPNVTGFSWMEKTSKSIIQCNPCPIDGGWSNWSPWSPCSTTCGEGLRRRTRLCDNPSPKYGGTTCQGNPEQTEHCTVASKCPESNPSISSALSGVLTASWSQWSTFSPCSVTCGIGFMERRRTCPNVLANCKGLSQEVHPCEASQSCNISSVSWMWTEWSPCHQTCGNGVRLRSKICLVIGKISGNQCPTEANVQLAECDLPPCEHAIDSEEFEGNSVSTTTTSVTSWLVPVVVTIVLLTLVVAFVLYRKKQIMRRKDLLKNLRKNHKIGKRLPSLPPTGPYEGYLPMTILMQSNVESDSKFVDEDGYEIPKEPDKTSISYEKDATDDSVRDEDSATNHVYEQLRFYQNKSECSAVPTDVPENLYVTSK